MTLAPALAILALPHDTGSETMRSTLFHAFIPDRSRPQTGYQNFVRVIRQIQAAPGVDHLADNVWLLEQPLHQPFLVTLLALAKTNAVACRTLEVDVAPTWQSYP
jgi:hypothetical protein